MKKRLSAFVLGLFVCQFAFGQDMNKIFERNVGYLAKKPLPVEKSDELPWFWGNYGGDTTEFRTDIYQEIFKKISPTDFVAAMIKKNDKVKPTGSEYVTVHRFNIKDGQLYIVFDRYYVTLNEKGELVSLMIEGEEEGRYPEGTDIRGGDDLLCYFKGERAGTCSIGDDT